MYAVSIDVYRGRAYLPVQARFESGIWTGIEPVFTAELNVDELVAAIMKVIEAGHQTLPDPTREEGQKQKDPILAATKARSWKALARNGASYSIHQTNDQIRVDMSYTDKKGRWQNDPKKVRVLPEDTPLEEIAEIILEDIRARPEVQ
jgi:hypothetical protein